MIATEEAGLDGFLETKHVIEDCVDQGIGLVSANIVCSSHLFQMVCVGDLKLAPHQKHTILKRMGFMPRPDRVTIRGHKTHIWVKSGVTERAIEMWVHAQRDDGT